MATTENIKAYPPKELLIGLTSDGRGGGLVFPAAPAYRCQRCGTITSFGLGAKEPPEFSFAIRKSFDQASSAVQLSSPYEKDYCDLVCGKCGQPVRVVYGVHEFAMSCYRYLPQQVLVYELT